MEDNKMLNIYEQIRGDFPEIALLYFFGSRVNGKVGIMSDYDLAIIVDGQVDNLEIQTRLTHAMIINLGMDQLLIGLGIVSIRYEKLNALMEIISEIQGIVQMREVLAVKSRNNLVDHPLTLLNEKIEN